jgi:hypothetical protein
LNCIILTASTKSQLQLYVAHNNSSSLFGKLLVGAKPTAARRELRPLADPQIHRCPIVQAQASLMYIYQIIHLPVKENPLIIH